MHYNSLHTFPEAITGAFSQASPYKVCPSVPLQRLRGKKGFGLVKQSKKVKNSFKSGAPVRNRKILQLSRCCEGRNPISGVHTLCLPPGAGAGDTAELTKCQHISGRQEDVTAWIFSAISLKRFFFYLCHSLQMSKNLFLEIIHFLFSFALESK